MIRHDDDSLDPYHILSLIQNPIWAPVAILDFAFELCFRYFTGMTGGIFIKLGDQDPIGP